MKIRKRKSMLDQLKSRFQAAGCTVSDVSKSSFDFSHSDFPIGTLVTVDAHYIQFSTVMAVIPAPSKRSDGAIYKFLSDANDKASLVKFTLDESLYETVTNGWPVLASAKLVSGLIRSDYDGDGLRNLVMLWFADIAEIVASTKGFTLQMMFKTNDT